MVGERFQTLWAGGVEVSTSHLQSFDRLFWLSGCLVTTFVSRRLDSRSAGSDVHTSSSRTTCSTEDDE